MIIFLSDLSINMMKVKSISLIFFIGCSDKNEGTYLSVLNLSSNTIDEFSKLGETRECYVECFTKPDLYIRKTLI